MSTLRVNTLQDATGSNQPAMVGAAKAWVNFNGTGTVALRESFNVSSITDNGTGRYAVNFTNNFLDNKYAISICVSHTVSNNNATEQTPLGEMYINNIGIQLYENGVATDSDACMVVVHR